jgi:hypothetical protein
MPADVSEVCCLIHWQDCSSCDSQQPKQCQHHHHNQHPHCRRQPSSWLARFWWRCWRSVRIHVGQYAVCVSRSQLTNWPQHSRDSKTRAIRLTPQSRVSILISLARPILDIERAVRHWNKPARLLCLYLHRLCGGTILRSLTWLSRDARIVVRSSFSVRITPGGRHTVPHACGN